MVDFSFLPTQKKEKQEEEIDFSFLPTQKKKVDTSFLPTQKERKSGLDINIRKDVELLERKKRELQMKGWPAEQINPKTGKWEPTVTVSPEETMLFKPTTTRPIAHIGGMPVPFRLWPPQERRKYERELKTPMSIKEFETSLIRIRHQRKIEKQREGEIREQQELKEAKQALDPEYQKHIKQLMKEDKEFWNKSYVNRLAFISKNPESRFYPDRGENAIYNAMTSREKDFADISIAVGELATMAYIGYKGVGGKQGIKNAFNSLKSIFSKQRNLSPESLIAIKRKLQGSAAAFKEARKLREAGKISKQEFRSFFNRAVEESRALPKDISKIVEAPIVKGALPLVQPIIKPKVKPELALRTQKAQAHILAKEKSMITPEGKTKPQYRRLALAMTGKKSMKDMTDTEADFFINALRKISEPYYKDGKLVPPTIPKTKRLVTQEFYKQRFKEPTLVSKLTPQTYYTEKLGVKKIVEPLETGKQVFDLQYRDYANSVEAQMKQIDKIGKTSMGEKLRAKVKNIPTKAVSETRDLLDKYEEAPAFLSPEKTKIFNWFRNLNRNILKDENRVRISLGLEPIKYRKAYVRHTADAIAKEMLEGRYPFPQGLKYWAEKIVGKKIFNPMEFHRQLADDLEKLWTKDLAHATKSMLWTGLKEINLTQPLKHFNEQLGAVSQDIKVYKNLTPEEREIYNQNIVIPASTKKWLIEYVNQAIKGQETNLDTSVNKTITGSGLKGVLNKILAPFGKTVGRKPITTLFQITGRATIHGVMGPIRPKQLIRNKFQSVQNLALYTLKANLKGFFPATKQMKELMDESLFLKTYTGFEELPQNIQGKLEKLNLAFFQWSALSNVKRAMKVAYWDTLDLIANPKYKDFGWADPSRTYKEPREFLYASEKVKILKEMEFGAGVTQYHYIPIAMPEVFRHKALVPFTRLQSWWMNHFFKFNREAASRMFKGETGYGGKLPWSRRIGYLRYLILGGAILNTLGYEKSFMLGAAPTGFPPVFQLMMGLYTYVTVDKDTAWGKQKAAQAKYRIFNSLKTFIPGYLAWKDFNAVWDGRKDLSSLFFYTKIKKRETTRFKRKKFKR